MIAHEDVHELLEALPLDEFMLYLELTAIRDNAIMISQTQRVASDPVSAAHAERVISNLNAAMREILSKEGL